MMETTYVLITVGIVLILFMIYYCVEPTVVIIDNSSGASAEGFNAGGLGAGGLGAGGILERLLGVRTKIYNNYVNGNECEEIAVLVKEASDILKGIVGDGAGEDMALCKYDLHRNVIDQNMSNSVTYDIKNWQSSYNTILEWESEGDEIENSDKALFIMLLKNVDLLITVLRSEVCSVNRLDLEKVDKILNKINDNLCSRDVEYASGVGLSDGGGMSDGGGLSGVGLGVGSGYVSEGDLITRGGRMDNIEAFTGMHRKSYLTGELGDSLGTIDDSEMVSWEHVSDIDILEGRQIGHSLGIIKDVSPYYTSRVAACNGRVVAGNRLGECVVGYDKMKSALDGDPTKMISGLSESIHN